MQLLDGIKVMALSWWSILDDQEIRQIIPEFAGWKFEHAGRAETALMMYYQKTLLRILAAIHEDIPLQQECTKRG